MMKKLLLTLFAAFAFLFGNVSLTPVPYVPVTASGQTAQASAAKSYAIQIAEALPRISIGSPAYATELNPDPGFDTPGAWMLDPTSPNLWTVSGSKANGNSAKAMQMLMGSNAAIKRGHTYHYSLVVAGMTHGVVELGIGPTMTGTATGVWRNTLTAVADNFTTVNGRITTGDAGSASVDEVGAFRMFCGDGPIDNTDPVVRAGQAGASHTHSSWGNTNSLDVRGNYSFWRTTGGSTCGNVDTQKSPLNRSAYWMPSMLDGVGNVVRFLTVNQYYKGYPATGAQCTNPSDPDYVLGPGGACVDLPNGLSMIAGYNFATGLGGPAGSDGSNNGYWECEGHGSYRSPDGTDIIGHRSQHLKDFFGGGCYLQGQGTNPAGTGGVIAFKFFMQTCWDGVHTDSPDHRSHVSYATRTLAGGGFFGGCDASFPYHFASPEPQVFWKIDANFSAGKWHLSSDEMVAGKVSTDPGGTMHMDYTEAWSPTIRQAWHTNCIDAHKSCNHGALGDGTEVRDGGIIASTHGAGDPDQMYGGTTPLPTSRYFPLSKIGIGKPITANGTYTGEITADADGRFSLIAIEDSTGAGFNGTVDSLSIVEVTSGHRGPVTITH